MDMARGVLDGPVAMVFPLQSGLFGRQLNAIANTRLWSTDPQLLPVVKNEPNSTVLTKYLGYSHEDVNRLTQEGVLHNANY
jgi:hypothetical protein